MSKTKSRKPQFAMMPWYPRDFDSATKLWPLLARGAYRELLDMQWDVGGVSPGVLPEDDEQLRELIRATAAEWKKIWPYIEPKFPRVLGGRQNAKLEEHRQVAVRNYLGRQKGAQATNRKLGRLNGSLSETPSDSLSDSDSER
jgi:uncharacterized protein YdaU (DUF1376 family)